MTKLLGAVGALQLALLLSLSACEGSITSDPTTGDDTGADLTVAPDGSGGTGGTPDEDVASGPMITVTFAESTEHIVNPERGFYVGYNLLDPSRAATVRAAGHTLALSLVRLDSYRDKPLDAALLSALDAGLAAARAAGIKVILRFTYNSSFSADASKERILGHVAQVSPLLHENADVISVMQAGFIGAWGEWHSSTNGLDNDQDRTDILNAILDALPSSRTVQIRTPMFKAAAVGDAALTEAEAYTGTARARTGHHNDCFLASASDLGTFASPVATWQAYVAADGQFTAIGGETCAVYEARTNCAAAIAAMETQHWSYLNREYNQSVINGWIAAGCEPEIRQRLGYRFALDHVAHSEAVAPGGVLELEVAVRNLGFASPFNRRPVEIVLSNGAVRHHVQLADLDARTWKAGETSSFFVRLRVPAGLTAGTYAVALRLPDEADNLADDARYAIRLANPDLWDAQTGDNVLTRDLVVDPAAPGSRDNAATGLTELP